MKVDKDSKYKLIFSVSEHPYLGVMIHPYVVAYTSLDTLSLTHQKLFSGNATHYNRLTEKQLELISMLDPLMVEGIIRKFSPVSKIRPKEFFRKHYSKEIESIEIRPYIETHLSRFLAKITPDDDFLYVADEINPAAIPVRIQSDFTKVLFHFRRNENGTSYFVTLKHQDERIPFMKLGALLLTKDKPGLIVNGKLYKFYDFVDGNKLGVFINKKFVHIKPQNERRYFSKFVKNLMETAPVFAQGFNINTIKENASPILKLSRHGDSFGFDLFISYGEKVFPYERHKLFHVDMNWDNGPHFTKYKRSTIWEENRVKALSELGLEWEEKQFFSLLDSSLAITMSWLRENKEVLEISHFTIDSALDKHYSTEKTSINYNISDKIDWFDLNVVVIIGEFEIPFAEIVKEMKKGNTEIELPNGLYFVFPKEWLSIGEALSTVKSKNNVFSVKKYQVDVLGLIQSKTIKDHISKLVDIKKERPHKNFNGKLRKYQNDGLSWLMFLYNNRFGGILADDMGLGKTVQTIAFLQKVKMKSKWKVKHPRFLLVAPTSLLYNWKQEVATFAPDLRTKIHSGIKRSKRPEDLENIDLLITSYGLIRNDVELMHSMEFDIVVLDESQNIKNHTAKTTQSINQLFANTRIALTGTPIENTVKDLWSQMNFLNKGQLGPLRKFEENFAKPIEKLGDKDKAEELKRIIKPFLLRRTKSEVAKDLPPLSEKVIFCEMTTEQKEYYEEVKSKYRNSILDTVKEKGLNKSKFSILQGLSKLRQIANHPYLIDKEYTHLSGKHEMLLQKINNALIEGHKVLVFSQFVSYLEILEKDIKKAQHNYYKLTGSTTSDKRQQYVNDFQGINKPSVFLISLKAGGTGLNLTSADYVFIVDPWWNPAAESQARDRTHRIGQEQNVFSYKFISRDTIEEKIVSLQQKKQGYAKDIIVSENNILTNLDLNELRMLLT